MTVLIAAGAASAKTASAVSAFHTPNWAAYCFVPVAHERPLSSSGLACITPNDGFTVSMGSRSRVDARYDRSAQGSREYFSAQRLLRFGRYWAVRPYWGCVSRRTGLTCWNQAGHGWWLGRFRGYRIF